MSRSTLVALLLAVGLTFIFWLPLWQGGGLIGGDIYTYFLPQKTFYADRLHAGEFPLWNNLTGYGYPLVGESQTGAFYPPNLILYRLFDVNTAYSAIHLLHYILAFWFFWLYARRIGLNTAGSLFAALVYTYGWFPARASLEWAIIGGAWLPLALWCVESFLQTRLWRYAIGLSITLGVQLLAGHFNLAFITDLVLAAYVPLRLWIASELLPTDSLRLRRGLTAGLVATLLCGFALAAVQLLPTWELKRQSQRAGSGQEHDAGYGHLPALYWSQVFAPWFWYSTDIDINAALVRLGVWSPPSATNKVEAHLYFGQVPLYLMLWGFVWPRFGGPRYSRLLKSWGVLGLLALLYTPGWFLPITQHLPGFGFFHGPGRYGIVTTLAVALLAGATLEQIIQRRVRSNHRRAAGAIAMILGVATLLTIPDLWWVGRRISDAVMVAHPPITYRDESPLRRMLTSLPQPARLLAPGPNLPTLLGVAATPVYLGIGPAPYYDPALTMPRPEVDENSPTLSTSPEQVTWLRRAGVTHVLSFKPLSRDWPARLVWQGFDPMLNRAWARYEEPLFLSELIGSRGRTAWDTASPAAEPRITAYHANRVAVRTESTTEGTLILTDLAWPDWHVAIDGQPAETATADGMYRAVRVPSGEHTVVWSYRPPAVYWGAILSGCAALLLAAIAHVRFWHPQWFGRSSRTTPV